MGIAIVPGLRLGDFHFPEHIQGLLFRFLAGAVRMQAHGFVHLPAHLDHRVQAGHGFLKNHGDFRPPQPPAFLFGKLCDLPAAQKDFSPGHLSRKPEQAHDGPGGHALSAARFAHDAHDFSDRHGERHVVHGQDNALFRMKADSEVFYLQHILFHVRPLLFLLPGVQHVQQAVP